MHPPRCSAARTLKCSSRTRCHHLLKTYWGWRNQQLRDGTMIWTSPSGETYVTTPGSALLFRSLCAPTGELTVPDVMVDGRCGERTAMMPTRRRTRAQNRAHRIAAERRQNQRAREARRQRWEDAYFANFPLSETTTTRRPSKGYSTALESCLCPSKTDVRLAVYRSFADTAACPDAAGLAVALGADADSVRNSLCCLAVARHVVLDNAERVALAHPFAAVPLGFSVMGSSTYQYRCHRPSAVGVGDAGHRRRP